MSLSPGFHLGPYEITATLGAGGMGEVYRARDTRLAREVAVKVLPQAVANDPDALTCFEREARAVAALSHPNILAIHDVGREQGVSFVVTELLDGETLRARLSVGALAPRKAVGYATQLAEGLAAAHERGLVHRDLKPENVFITRDGRVKLLDFGLAKPLEDAPGDTGPEAVTLAHVTLPGMMVGTPACMSPEQVRGEPADARSDLFAFGVVLYEMLSGRCAFEGRSVAETMSAVLRDEPPALSRVGAQIPSRFERIVRRCLEKSPGERFQAARDLAFALSTALEGTEETPAAGAPDQISVVVLPFANLSPDPDTEFLADGFTEEAISDLSAIRSLTVISRTSAMRLKGPTKTPRPSLPISACDTWWRAVYDAVATPSGSPRDSWTPKRMCNAGPIATPA